MSDSDFIALSEFQTGQSARFDAMGDKHWGRIVSIEKRPQTNPQTGAIQYFTDGITPRPMVVIAIEDASEDGEIRTLFAKGGNFQAITGSGKSMMSAIGDAGQAAGATKIEVGGELAVQFTGEGEKRPGLNAPKLYTAQYRPPQVETASVPVDLFSS